MKHNYKHILTSGCSFTAWTEPCWAHWLGEVTNIPVTNFGCPSAGNSWIAKTAIYGTHRLIDAGVSPEDILVAVMWSGIDRKEVFISKETPNYKNLFNPDQSNPVRFLDRDLRSDVGWRVSESDGYLLGSAGSHYTNNNINKFKQSLIRDYFCDEAMAIESYENFLRLQWYCQSKKVRLINLTYMDIMHYPKYNMNIKQVVPGTYDNFENIKHLHDMIDFNQWIFWDKSKGLFEYVRDHTLPYMADGFHPSSEANEHYVKNFLIDKL